MRPPRRLPSTHPFFVVDRRVEDESTRFGALAEALRLLDQRGHFEHEQRGREDALFHHAMMGSRLLQLGPSGLEREHLPAADSASAIRVPVHAVDAEHQVRGALRVRLELRGMGQVEQLAAHLQQAVVADALRQHLIRIEKPLDRIPAVRIDAPETLGYLCPEELLRQRDGSDDGQDVGAERLVVQPDVASRFALEHVSPGRAQHREPRAPGRCGQRGADGSHPPPTSRASAIAIAAGRADASAMNGVGPSTIAPVSSSTSRAFVATLGSSSGTTRLSTMARSSTPRRASASAESAQWLSVPSPARPTSRTGSPSRSARSRFVTSAAAGARSAGSACSSVSDATSRATGTKTPPTASTTPARGAARATSCSIRSTEIAFPSASAATSGAAGRRNRYGQT